MPITSNIADVVVSNCVLNLVPDKEKAIAEIYRVLKPGGHFSISDVVLVGSLPDKIQHAAEMYAGCISGALQKDTYLELIDQRGFLNITIQKEKEIIVPDDILNQYLTGDEMNEFKSIGTGIFSITVYAEKPSDKGQPCCEPGCCS